MAQRGLSAGMIAELEKERMHMCHLVDFDFSSAVYLTTHVRSLDWGGNTYLATGSLLSIEAVSESVSFDVGMLAVSLSGVDQANISAALSENFIGKTVNVYLALLDEDGVIIPDPLKIYGGTIDGFKVSESIGAAGRGTSVVRWEVASQWRNFDKTAGRRTNDGDQQSFYPGDLGMNYSGEIVKDLKWGRV